MLKTNHKNLLVHFGSLAKWVIPENIHTGPTMGGMNILTTLAFGNSKILYLPCPLNYKIINPPFPPEFPFFLRPFGTPVWQSKTSIEWETCTFVPPIKFCSQFSVKQTSSSSLLTFNINSKVHGRFPLYMYNCKWYLKCQLLTTK